jgi:hypothetical protein
MYYNTIQSKMDDPTVLQVKQCITSIKKLLMKTICY